MISSQASQMSVESWTETIQVLLATQNVKGDMNTPRTMWDQTEWFQGCLIQFSRSGWFQPMIINGCASGLIRSELSCCPVRTVNHGNHVDLAWK